MLQARQTGLGEGAQSAPADLQTRRRMSRALGLEPELLELVPELLEMELLNLARMAWPGVLQPQRLRLRLGR